jgi:flavin-dependent dehydrogenase
MKNYKSAVIGAGPAGLGAALALTRAGVEVDIFEKQAEIGLERRGETIRFNPEMEALLGIGFFESQAIHRVNKRRYYSHSGRRFIDRTISEFNLIIDWTQFLKAIAESAGRAGARIHLNSEIDEVVIKDAQVQGIKLKDKEYAADAVFSCGGHADPACRLIGIDRSRMDRPVEKHLVRNYSGPEDRLEYHFHADSRGIAVGCIFPRGKGEAELIIMGMKDSWLPGFEDFSESHKVFADRMKGTIVEYKLKTKIPMGAMLIDSMPRPRLIMAGDAMGHVQSRGGSGIRTSFLIAYSCGVAAANALKYVGWDNIQSVLGRSLHLIELKRHNLIYSKARRLMFKPAGSPERMDMLWPLMSTALR